jgi:Ankyrin repeats (3 copies)/Ankyrin repeat
MGNGASVDDMGNNELDEKVTYQVQRKKGQQAASYYDEGGEDEYGDDGEDGTKKKKKKKKKKPKEDEKSSDAATISSPPPQQQYQQPYQQPQQQQYSPAQQSPQVQQAYGNDQQQYGGGDGGEGDDLQPIQILSQFIPYYGQGDPSNDSIVRATLSSLSIDDIDSKDEYGNTLLLLACQYRCEDLVRIMLNKGADPNALNLSGACPLHFASYKESFSASIAKILLNNGANPEVKELTYGCTPLHYCAGTGDVEFCKMLLSYGAQVQTQDYYNYTCVDYAREAGMSAVAEYLQQKLDKAISAAPLRRGGGAMASFKIDPGEHAVANIRRFAIFFLFSLP